MNRRTLVKQLGLSLPAYFLSKSVGASMLENLSAQYANAPFKASWESLQGYVVPE
jgi:alpha-L-fucosidase